MAHATKRIIEVNEEYRLALDEHSVMIERLVTVDPTKSPKWETQKAEGASAELRHEWKNIGKYYGSIPQAIEGLLHYTLRDGADTDLRGILVEIDAFRSHIYGALGLRV